jgi:hypothetical protein
MSNQVFSNATQKYYAMRGINLYVPPDIQEAPVNVPILIQYNDRIVQNSDVIRVFPTGLMEILQDGVFSIHANLEVANFTSPNTYFSLYMMKNGTQLLANKVVSSALTAPTNRYLIGIDHVGYFAKGDTIEIYVENLIGDYITVIPAPGNDYTFAIVSKIM